MKFRYHGCFFVYEQKSLISDPRSSQPESFPMSSFEPEGGIYRIARNLSFNRSDKGGVICRNHGAYGMLNSGLKEYDTHSITVAYSRQEAENGA